ncbi:MAG TPA: hypothetical protein VFH45_03075 [Acidimicrobiales bacterium]|nr:hypothetical protein [Acidimicrobiales bacterium]
MADSRNDSAGATPTSEQGLEHPVPDPDAGLDEMNEQLLKGHIRALLDGLGGSPEEVAASLARAGVKGNRSDATGCPVATYLHAVTGADPQVRMLGVTTRRVLINRRRHWWTPHTRVALPAGVRNFVRRFDLGEFSELVAETDRSFRRRSDTPAP